MSDDPYRVPESKPETSPIIYWSIHVIPELTGLSRAEQGHVAGRRLLIGNPGSP